MKFSAAVARIMTAGVLVAVAGSVSAQQAYPNKPIRLITPYPPGGSTTTLARLVGQKLTESWGQQVIVDNRGGANTIIGTEALVRSAPDGYTLIHTNTALVVVPQLIPTSYDAIKDFAPVATLISSELVLVVNPSVAASNVQELVALAKANPGKLNYASISSGSQGHLGLELFSIMAGVKMQHIPYKGAGPVLTDLIGGQVQLYFANPINVVSYIKSGRLKAIAISGEHRMSSLPQVPTFAEAGMPGLNVDSWQGILAPAGTPKAIIDKLSTEIAKILAMPDIKEKLDGLGVAPLISSPDQFAARLKADMAKFAKVIKAANIKIE